jgi:hypothetical protein
MKLEKLLLLACIAVLICAQLVIASNQQAAAQACQGQGVEGDLTGSKDTAVVVGRAAANCTSATSVSPRQPVPYYTFEIRC